jgi:histone arginine demethylase JMJD6
MPPGYLPTTVGPKLTGDIDRHGWAEIGRARYYRDYVLALKPVIIRGAFDHWPARGKWNLHFLRDVHGDLPIMIDGNHRKLGEFIDEVLASTADRPAPYLRNHLMALWPDELQAAISPMPDCTRPNWLESDWFPSRTPLTYIEAFIGGPGARFPVLHYDGLHTHAFLMQIEGVKEYVAFPPESEVYPQGNLSQIDVENPDFDHYPLFARAAGFRFNLYPGETLFVPAGWWHTARILTPSITISVNCVNAANWKAFRRDFCSRGRRIKLLIPYLEIFRLLQDLADRLV